MIKGKIIQERVLIEKPVVNYRKIDALNQSMLKIFDENPLQFFNEFKLGKKRPDKKNTSLIIGDLVDFYVLQCKGDEECFQNRFDEKFAMLSGIKGSGQVFLLSDILYEVTEEQLSPEGKITTSFENRFHEACMRIKNIKDGEGNYKYYKNKAEDKILEDFDKHGKAYFETRIDNVGKVAVDQSLVDKAMNVGNTLLTDEFTRDIFRGNDDLEYLTHYPIEWDYHITDEKKIACKSEVDGILVDHDNKVIQPFDLKTSFDNEGFDYMYIKNSYYLQNAFYYKAVQSWKNEEKMSNYKTSPLKFVVGDTSSNNRRPLVYNTTEEDIQNGWLGFTMRGTKYRGVKELVEAIAWAEETGNWNVAKEAFDNGGQMKLNIQYDNS